MNSSAEEIPQIQQIRSRFPALEREAAGARAVYLDGPAGSQVPSTVARAMHDYLLNHNANTGGAFITSIETDAIVGEARAAAADFCNVHSDEIAFGPNMTTLNYLLAHAAARTLAPGDEIIVTDLDHDANVSPWLQIAADHELVVKRVPLNNTKTDIDYSVLDYLLSPRTRIVAYTLASNALGTVTDARRIADAAHRAGALAWADAVHFAPHRRIDREKLQFDILVCSSYKFFGPHLAFAAIRKDLAERWPADRVRPAEETPPGRRFETGTPSIEAFAGFVACVDYLQSLAGSRGASRREKLQIAFDHILQYESGLARAVLENLSSIRNIHLHGVRDANEIDARVPTFCISVDHKSPLAVSRALAARGIFTWSGNYYALAVMESLGLQDRGGALRAGFLHYNTHEEAARFCSVLAEIVKS